MEADMPDRIRQMPLLDVAQLDMLREALDEDELQAMLSELPQTAMQAIDAIEQAVKTNDLDGARRAAHVLKGVASSFGAARLAEMAREIELDMATIDRVAACVPELIATVERTAAAFSGGVRPADHVAS